MSENSLLDKCASKSSVYLVLNLCILSYLQDFHLNKFCCFKGSPPVGISKYST